MSKALDWLSNRLVPSAEAGACVTYYKCTPECRGSVCESCAGRIVCRPVDYCPAPPCRF